MMTTAQQEEIAREFKASNYRFSGTRWDDGYNVGVQTMILRMSNIIQREREAYCREGFLVACGLDRMTTNHHECRDDACPIVNVSDDHHCNNPSCPIDGVSASNRDVSNFYRDNDRTIAATS